MSKHLPFFSKIILAVLCLITIKTSAQTSAQSDYFRTRQSGNWNDVNTWESSPVENFSSGVVSPATIFPGTSPSFNPYKSRNIRNTHIVAITENLTANAIFVKSGGTLIVNPNIILTVPNNKSGANLYVEAGGSFILKSTATGTASIYFDPQVQPGDNFTVERFINASTPPKSAWRLLTAPLQSTTGTNGTIFDNWQNGGINTTGRGTKVTGPAYNGTNGLDAYTLNPSMLWWDVTSQTMQPVTATNNPAITPLFKTASNYDGGFGPPIPANIGYFIFIDGDRLALPGVPNSTTLSATGNLQAGDQKFTLSSTANAFNLIGNPYAASVDLNQLRLDNTANNVKSTYYYWDPYLTGTYGYGGYVTVSYDAGGAETIVPAGADHTRFLQSGQAMFVQTNTTAAASLVFKETQKNATTINNIFRTQTSAIENIAVNLKVIAADNPVLIDGVITNFDNTYAAEVDRYDAPKMYNMGESISFMRNSKSLSIERRPFSNNDVLFLNLEKLKEGITYQLEINPTFSAAGINAYLVDNYLKTTTPLDMSKATIVNFTINGDAASTGANRFSISFAKPAIVQNTKPGISVYPNPVTNGVINLQMNNMPQGWYNVRVVNNLGQIVLTKQINHATGSSTQAIQLGKWVKGVYHMEVTKPDKSKFSTKVIAN